MSIRFDPYHKWLGIPRKDQPPHYYRLLGVPALESDAEVISNAADQRMGLLKTFANSPHSSLAEDLLDEVARARVCLLNPAKKRVYDNELRRRLGGTTPRSPLAEAFWLPTSRVVDVFDVLCPHCEEENIYQLAAGRQILACNACGKRFRVPGQNDIKRAAAQVGLGPPTVRSQPTFDTQADIIATSSTSSTEETIPAIDTTGWRSSTARRSRRRRHPAWTLFLMVIGGFVGIVLALCVLFILRPDNPILVRLGIVVSEPMSKSVPKRRDIGQHDGRAIVGSPLSDERDFGRMPMQDDAGMESRLDSTNDAEKEPAKEVTVRRVKPEEAARQEMAADETETDDTGEAPTEDIVVITPAPDIPLDLDLPATDISLALTGREPSMKQALLKAFGGTRGTEGAVGLGLRWLATQQRRNGTWSLKGPYSDGGNSENVEAATAMALLAFQGAGFTPAGNPTHPFTRVVRRGSKVLLQRMKNDGRFYDDVAETHTMYTQAQCTIALCELYAMTGDARYHDASQKAVDYCVRVQSPQGGWRYLPDPAKGESDTSVTGWMVAALETARMAGIEVPSPVFERIEQFFDSVARDGGSRYAYQSQAGATLTLTAEGLLCRQYLGWSRDDPRLNAGAEYLLNNLPNWNKRNVYYWYHATQFLHHMEGDAWRKWNLVMRKTLPDHQVTRGRERGSWDPTGDRWRGEGGRLYTTCLSLYILEVYYRHLPLYERPLRHASSAENQ
jgi:hypothetical protein